MTQVERKRIEDNIFIFGSLAGDEKFKFNSAIDEAERDFHFDRIMLFNAVADGFERLLQTEMADNDLDDLLWELDILEEKGKFEKILEILEGL